MSSGRQTIKVTVDKSHLFTLGEKMYRESVEFLRELVNNAYDADATKVNVLIGEDNIVVEDNGSGMNVKGLEQFFTIGSEEKTIHSISPKFGRRRIGQFGIGKFSALSLAEQFIVESVRGKNKYSVTFDKNIWRHSDHWELPILIDSASPLDKEGTKVILNKLIKKVNIYEAEKYIRQSVPLRAKKFNVYVNNKKISSVVVPGKIFPVKINLLYGTIEGEIIVAISAADVGEPGVECRVKQVLITRELFGLAKKYHHGCTRICGSVNADFLPLIVSRADFVHDSEEYKLFYTIMRAELEKILEDARKQSEIKNLKKITEELVAVLGQIREALLLNPDFIPQGRVAKRLKAEGKTKPVAGIDLSASALHPRGEAVEKRDGQRAPEKEKTEKPTMEVDSIVSKGMRLKKFGVVCSIASLGETGPEVMSQGNMIDLL